MERDIRFADRMAGSCAALVGTAFVLAVLGRLSVSTPADAVDLSRARADTISVELETDPLAAEGFVARRGQWPALRSVDDAISHAGLQMPASERLRDRIVVRSAGDVTRAALTGLFILIAGLIGCQAILRASGPAGDPFLLPAIALISGIALCCRVGGADLLRSELTILRDCSLYTAGLAAFIVGALATRFRGDRSGWGPFGAVSRSIIGRHIGWVFPVAVITSVVCALRGAGASWYAPIAALAAVLGAATAARSAESGEDRVGWQLSRRTRTLAIRYHLAPDRADRMLLAAALASGMLFAQAYGEPGAGMAVGIALALPRLLASGRALPALAGAVGAVLTASAVRLFGGGQLALLWREVVSPFAASGTSARALWTITSHGVVGGGLGLAAPAVQIGAPDGAPMIAEALGLAGIAAVTIGLMTVAWRAVDVARTVDDHFDRLLAASLGLTVGLLGAMSLGGACGLLPIRDPGLPFTGGSVPSLVLTFGAGLIYSVSRESRNASPPISAPAFAPMCRRSAVAVGVLLFAVFLRYAWLEGVSDRSIAATPLVARVAGATRTEENPRLAEVRRQVQRGSLLDRRGRILATSRLGEIARLLPGAPADARRAFARGRYTPVGESVRWLVGIPSGGRAGAISLESLFDDELRGFQSPSELLGMYRDANIPSWLRRSGAPVGRDVVTSIDLDLQEDAYRSLARQCTRSASPYGVLMASSPGTGEMIAYARWGRSRIAGPDDVRGLGGVATMATTLAGIGSGSRSLMECKHSAGPIEWNWAGTTRTRLRLADDPAANPHDAIGLRRAFRMSCDVYFARLGVALGPQKLWSAASLLGFHTSVDALGPVLPDAATGQAMRGSPQDVLGAVQVLCGGGISRPLVWRRVGAPPEGERRVSASTANELAGLMVDVVAKGPARGAFDGLHYAVAGKTGTYRGPGADGTPDAWFAGYAPVVRPVYAFTCMIEGGGLARDSACGVVRGFLQEAVGP